MSVRLPSGFGLPAALALAGALVCLACAGAAGQDAAALKVPTLTVSGTGMTKATPDVAVVTVGVVTNGKRAQEAAQANAALSQKVIDALKQHGLADKDIQTSEYTVQPQYRENNVAGGIVGYQISNLVTGTVRKLGNVGAVIDAALDAGANNVQSVRFDLENRSAAEAEALAQAVREARRKAAALATAADVQLKGILRIEGGSEPRPIVPVAQFGIRSSMAAATPISPGELTVTADVTIVYQIEQAGARARLPERASRRVAQVRGR